MSAFIKKYQQWLFPAGLLLVSLLVYMTNYTHPNSLFWDENYHIASAQKHLDGVMYMEPHPPLGKMLIAAGEALLGTNKNLDKSALNGTSYITNDDLPEGFSFAGMRLASTLLMALSVLFFYGLLYRLIGHRWVAAAFSTLIIFDNALVVHSRAAMLEGIQLFFMMGALYYLVCTITSQKRITLKNYAILGVLIGLVISVKLNGAILLLLMVVLFCVDQWPNIRNFRALPVLDRLTSSVPCGVLPILAVFFGVFYIHIAFGTDIANNMRYKASPEYLEYLREGKTHTPGGFVTGMKDHWTFMSEYADGVPRLDMCKEGENGSLAIGWPVGTKTISYRWNKDTIDGQVYVGHLYLLGNPIVWFSVVLGMLLSVGLLISRFIYNNPVKDQKLFAWIGVFTTLYICYMIAVMQIERVMYMYHYLVALIFGIINLALVFTYLFRNEILANKRITLVNVGLFVALVVGVFAFFAPLTYGIPITPEQFEQRMWFDFWLMSVVR